MVKIKTKTLKNGLRILSIQNDSDTVTVQTMVNTGSHFETKQNNGISHFLEHMCFKGTETQEGKEIMRFLDGLGARTNAWTDNEITSYHVSSQKKHWKKTLATVADIYLHPLFPEKDIEIEKGVILGEIDMYDDDPAYKVYDVFDRAFYGNQPAGRPILGPKKNIIKMTRSDFLNYHKDHYVSGKTVVVVSGNIEAKKAFKEVEKHFKKNNEQPIVAKEIVVMEKNGPFISLHKKESNQSHIHMGFKTVEAGHKDYAPLSILGKLLGGGMSSRLFEKIRDELGLGYYVYSYQSSHTDNGRFAIGAGVDSSRIIEFFKAVGDLLGELMAQPVDQKEFDKVREYMMGNLIMSLESSSALSNHYGRKFILGSKMMTPKKILKEFNNITPKDLQRVAKKYFIPENLVVAIVGPHTGHIKKKIISALDLG